MRAQGVDVLNLGIGSPDLSPPPVAVKELSMSLSKSEVHGYQPYQGIPRLRKSIADFMHSQFEVTVDESTEILPLMGSKEGIMHISMAYLNRGDKVLVPSLGYPTYASVTQLMESEVLQYPLDEKKNYAPDWDYFDELPKDVKILWINYPHMPTGVKGTPALFRQYVEVARRKNLLLVHDNPYSFIRNNHPLSIFSIPGSEEVSLELHSLSKTFNMAGWRVGWLAGAKALIDPVLRVKSNMDSGMFRPVQEAASSVLSLGSEWFNDQNKVYSRRFELAKELVQSLHCSMSGSEAGMFAWAKTDGVSGRTLVDQLLSEKNIFVTPGDIFGEQGAEFIRISLCNSEQQFAEAIKRVST